METEVKRIHPDAQHYEFGMNGKTHFIIAGESIIGEGLTETQAWEDAWGNVWFEEVSIEDSVPC